jgi:hypothetical protein
MFFLIAVHCHSPDFSKDRKNIYLLRTSIINIDTNIITTQVPVLFVSPDIFFVITRIIIKKPSKVFINCNDRKAGLSSRLKKSRELMKEAIINTRINGYTLLNKDPDCFHDNKSIKPSPHEKVVIINETGVPGLYHDFTVGSV